ncbi:MAG: type II toxin-antitoxin system VapC family toxin [Gemmataceae bacterium]|nr:type II toxin-antitoxin system VapC family toxin [Gemmataceae bacterium]
MPDQPAFVLDGSVTLAWHFPDEQNAYADAVGRTARGVPSVVPAIWSLEVANTLIVGERRKRTTAVDVAEFLTELKGLPIFTDGETLDRVWADTLALARKHLLTVYDAAYLELAARKNLPLASLDGPLKKAAVAAGVGVYAPPVADG